MSTPLQTAIESKIALQKIDCNCNDCKHMARDFEKFEASQELHKKWQLDYFNTTKDNIIKKAEEWKSKGEEEKYTNLMNEANKMKFQFDRNESKIAYGTCDKLKKPVSFIPGICQLDTQQCFEHRKG